MKINYHLPNNSCGNRDVAGGLTTSAFTTVVTRTHTLTEITHKLQLAPLPWWIAENNGLNAYLENRCTLISSSRFKAAETKGQTRERP